MANKLRKITRDSAIINRNIVIVDKENVVKYLSRLNTILHYNNNVLLDDISSTNGISYRSINLPLMKDYINRLFIDDLSQGQGFRKTILLFSDLNNHYSNPVKMFTSYNSMLYKKLFNLSFLLQKSFLGLFNRANYRKLYNISLTHLLQYRVGVFLIGPLFKPLPFIPALLIGNISGNTGTDIALSIAAAVPFLPYALLDLKYLGSRISKNKDVVRTWLKLIYYSSNEIDTLYKTNKGLLILTGISFDYLPHITRVLQLAKILESYDTNYGAIFDYNSNKLIFKIEDLSIHNWFGLSDIRNDIPRIQIHVLDNTEIAFDSEAYIDDFKVSRLIKTLLTLFVGGNYPIIYNKGTGFTKISFKLNVILEDSKNISDHINKLNTLLKLKTIKGESTFLNIDTFNIIDQSIQLLSIDMSLPPLVTWYTVYDDEDKLYQYKQYTNNIKNGRFDKTEEKPLDGTNLSLDKIQKILNAYIKRAVPMYVEYQILCVYLSSQPYEWSIN